MGIEGRGQADVEFSNVSMTIPTFTPDADENLNNLLALKGILDMSSGPNDL